MADIQFDEEQYAAPNAAARKPSWLIGMVMRLGLAQDETGAQKVLVIILIVTIVAIVAVNMFSGSSSIPPPPSITGAPGG